MIRGELEVVDKGSERKFSDETTDAEIYGQYLNLTWLRRRYILPIFLCVFILLLYLLGKFLAAGVGRWMYSIFDRIVARVPLVSNVYSSVKQVTDFVFSEREIQFNRVVAIEYPRKGIWSLGFVTGESLLDIRSAANQPILSILIPTSPMPATGYTISVLKSETIDMNLTVDQAIQFIVSCGVVIPPQQLQNTGNADRFSTADVPVSVETPTPAAITDGSDRDDVSSDEASRDQTSRDKATPESETPTDND